MGRRLVWIQRTKSKFKFKAKQTRNWKSIKYRGERRGETLGKIFHSWPKGLWYRREDDTLYSSQPCIWKTEKKASKLKKNWSRLRSILWLTWKPWHIKFRLIWVRCRKKSSRIIFSDFQRNHQMFRFIICRWKNCDPRRTEKLCNALRLGHASSTKMLPESINFWCSGMRDYIENKCSTGTACMSSGKKLKLHLSLTEKSKLPILTEPA